jgi:hypothetical protein
MTTTASAGNSVDVYSFGILLCCMSSRTMPYAEYSDINCYQLLMQILQGFFLTAIVLYCTAVSH